MFKNYVKIAWRNLLKHRTSSFINIVGLSFSVAFCLLLFFHIRQEQSYDSFHQKKDRLFRLEMTNLWEPARENPKAHLFSFLTKNDDVRNNLIFPLVVGTDMQNTFPEVKSITRFKDMGDHYGAQLIKANQQVYKEPHVLYVENNFFNNLSFHLKKGNPSTVFASPKNVVLSESVAKKYFGQLDAIGKTIELVTDSNRLFKVAGIAEDAPANSSIRYTLLLPIQSDPSYGADVKERFNHSSHLFIVELADGVPMAQFAQKLDLWAKAYFNDYVKQFQNVNLNNFHWFLRPLTDCHYNAAMEWGHYTNANNIYQLACLVIIILLIASLNYVLLAISNAAARSQEVGVRKVMGANRRAIIIQFWVETQLVVLISIFFGLILSKLLLPVFNNMIGSDLRFDQFSWSQIIPALLVLCIGLGIIAGYYPALIISKMKPVSILKSFSSLKINPRFSKVVVVVQYTACVVLMISAFVIHRQMRYVDNKDLGFDREQVLMVSNPTFDFNFTKIVRDRMREFAKTQPYIVRFSGMNGGLDGSYNTNGFQLNGEHKERKQLTVDYDYFEMLGLKFVQGRSFSRAFPSDSSRDPRACIVNETLFAMLGKTAKLGQYCEPIDATIIGIVKDYNFETLSQKIEPEEHVLARNFEGSFMFKIKAGQMEQAISKIEKEWKQITNNYPFEYTFLDHTISKMYETDLRWQRTIQASCFFAIFIACMGLFGLSSINATNRTKEIGIRKVLGASVKDIVAMLSSDFLVMVFLSIVIAAPIAWWVMSRWLEDFTYRIDITWWMFAIIGISALLIALATVSFQAIKVALGNPIKSLRTE